MNTRKIFRAALLLLALLGLRTALAAPADWAGGPGGRSTPNYHALYVFGDSLSDTGNDIILTRSLGMDPPVPPSNPPHRTYWEGRFSNGPVAAEYLWQQLTREQEALVPSRAVRRFEQKLSVNFAYGGSGSGYKMRTPGGFEVPGVLGQVDEFRKKLRGKKANKQALYLVWTGANDYIFYGARDPRLVVGNIVASIKGLYLLGARDFLVPNLPDLSISPLVRSRPVADQEGLKQLTLAHNAILAQSLQALSYALPGASIRSTDTYAVTQEILGSWGPNSIGPALDYLAPGTGASLCLLQDYPNLCPNVNLSASLPPLIFWDVLHPTTAAHEILGRAMYEQLRR
jgi:phospholipase/lecithinase/hemolysin